MTTDEAAASVWSTIEDSWRGHDLDVLVDMARRNIPPLAAARHMFDRQDVTDAQYQIISLALRHAREKIVWVDK